MRSNYAALCAVISAIAPSAALADQHDSDRYPADLPEALEVGDDEKLSFVTYAEGVQIYDCKDSAWVFRAPEATLYSPDGDVVGVHYVGPTWESNSGGYVVAAVAARVNSTDPNAIPWLRLDVIDSDGPGLFSKTTTIQRLETVGGRAPAGACVTGAVAEVPYEATYYFYKPQNGH